MNLGKVLIVDDEVNMRKILSAMLQAEGYEAHSVATLAEAMDCLRAGDYQVVLSDLRLKREDGSWLLKWIREEQMYVPVVILTAHGTIDSAVDAMKQGAFDFVSKPFDRTELSRILRKATLTYEVRSHHFLKASAADGGALPMIGRDKKMQKIFSLIEKVAETDATVLISGESGTGKELIAEALHEKSARAKGAFIKINCAAIPNTLMESELFGYEKGAFTGAVNSKPGRFELADGGTLFLDEIGEMNTEMQVKLLRVLQDQTFERVGGIRTCKVNVRLITATNKDLEKEVKEGRFRDDLYYRLNVVPIWVPPLRERPDDIPLLVAHFLKKFSERLKKNQPSLSGEALQLLSVYHWPGNIRQLENTIERLVVMSEGDVFVPEDLPEEILEFENEKRVSEAGTGGSLKEIVKGATRHIEKQAILDALRDTSQNVSHAAKKLNISRKGLQLKMKELGLR